MVRVKVILFFIVLVFIVAPGTKVSAATTVSDEAGLREALANGEDVLIQNNITLSEPLVINGDVNIDTVDDNEVNIYANFSDDLITINGGNVVIDAWISFMNYKGNAMVINGGNINLSGVILNAMGTGLIVNGNADVTFNGFINSFGNGAEVNGGKFIADIALESKGNGLIVNGGEAKLTRTNNGGFSSDLSAIVVNNNAKVIIDGSSGSIRSNQGNGIEINDGSMVELNGSGSYGLTVGGSTNAIYLNGGAVQIAGRVGLATVDDSPAININKTNINNDEATITLKKDFVFVIYRDSDSDFSYNFNVSLNPNLKNISLVDEKNFFSLENNKLSCGFCVYTLLPMSQRDDERQTICQNLGAGYTENVIVNELPECLALNINGKETIVGDNGQCTVSDGDAKQPAQVVAVPETFASNVINMVIGMILMIVAVVIIALVINKRKIS